MIPHDSPWSPVNLKLEMQIRAVIKKKKGAEEVTLKNEELALQLKMKQGFHYSSLNHRISE